MEKRPKRYTEDRHSSLLGTEIKECMTMSGLNN